MEDTNAPDGGSTPDDGAADDDPGSTPGGAEGEDDPLNGQHADGDGDGAGDESPADEPPADDEDPQYQNLVKKFAHIKNPRDRNAAIAAAYWEKNRYASHLRKENEELRARVARGPEPPKEADPPPPPHPDLQKLDDRIKGLSERDEAAYNQQQDLLKKLPEADARIVELKTLLRDDRLDEYAKQALQARLETAEGRKERLLEKWADVVEKRTTYKQDADRLQTERAWTAKVVAEQQARQKSEAQDLEQFNEAFPKQVSDLIQATAKELKAPSTALPGLEKVVTDRLSMALFRLDQRGIDEVDVKGLVASLTKEYLADLGLANRKTFQDISKGKLAVSGRPPVTKNGTPAGGTVTPPQKGPIPAASLGRGELTSAMARARQRLQSRGL